MGETMEERVTRLLLEYAQNVPRERPFPSALSIRKDLAVESLSLVAVTLSLGEELGVDATEAGIDFGQLDTVGDLVVIARQLASQSNLAGVSTG
jgi:hypothetical protein